MKASPLGRGCKDLNIFKIFFLGMAVTLLPSLSEGFMRLGEKHPVSANL
jgi:hypothetical protein